MDKCFCHLNGYAVKDATARKEIETLKSEYRFLELPIGAVMISADNEDKIYQLTSEEALTNISNFITEIAKSEIKRPIFKVTNSSLEYGEYEGMPATNTDCVEVLFTNCMYDISEDINVYAFFGYCLTNADQRWNAQISVTGEWANGVYTAKTLTINFKKQDTGGSTDLTGYATEDYVNDAIANIDIPEGGGSSIDSLPVVYSTTTGITNTSGSLDSDCLTQLTTLINTYENAGKTFPGFVLTCAGNTYARILTRIANNRYDSSKWEFKGLTYDAPLSSQPTMIYFPLLTLVVSGDVGNRTVTNGTYSPQAESIFMIDGRNNYAFTPTSNYHPATKKYVDDTVASAAPLVKIYEVDNIEDTSSTGLTQLGNVLTECYTKTEKYIHILDKTTGRIFSDYGTMVSNQMAKSVICLEPTIYNSPQKLTIGGKRIVFNISIADSVVTVSSIDVIDIQDQNVYIGDYDGFDSTSLQVLKNVNGTIKWVTETYPE